MPITHEQALKAQAALMQIAQLDGIPAVPTGMAIRHGLRLLKDICQDIKAEYDRLGEQHIERDEEGQKIVGGTLPDGTQTWKLKDPKAWAKVQADFYAAEVAPERLKWTMPAAFLAGVKMKPQLLIDLGDLLTEDGG